MQLSRGLRDGRSDVRAMKTTWLPPPTLVSVISRTCLGLGFVLRCAWPSTRSGETVETPNIDHDQSRLDFKLRIDSNVAPVTVVGCNKQRYPDGVSVTVAPAGKWVKPAGGALSQRVGGGLCRRAGGRAGGRAGARGYP